jgi:RNA polymerase sigma-70 factor, ECF subfamily
LEPDEELFLIERCKKYDSTAQQELYTLYRKKMFSVCMQYMNNYEDAKDMLQEGFIKILTDIRQYKGAGSFEGWMRRVMINTILMEFRKRKKMRFDSIENLELLGAESNEEINTLEADLNTMTEQELLSLLEKLPDDLRIVFNLFCIEGQSHKEIAQLLSINENNSRIKLLRARKALQKHISDYIVNKVK